MRRVNVDRQLGSSLVSAGGARALSWNRIFLELHDAYYEAAGAMIGQRQFLVADPDGYLLRFCQVIGERRLGV